MSLLITLSVAGFLLIIILLISGAVIIPQSQAMVIERLGRYNRTLYAGLKFKIPLIEKPRVLEWRYVEYDAQGKPIYQHRHIQRIDLREKILDFPRQNVITSDNIFIEINALLSYQIIDPKSVAYKIDNLPFAMEKEVQTCLRSQIGAMTLDQILDSREVLNSRIREQLETATSPWGVKINRVAIQEITPPEDIRDQMEKVMRAERDRRAAVTTAEGAKTAAILESEGRREAAVNLAEAEKRSMILKAEGEAYFRLRMAQAEADAMRRIAEALQERDINPAQYLIAQRYLETLKEMVSGKDNKVVYLPIEAVGVLSSLAGIRDLFREAEPKNIVDRGDDGVRKQDQGLAGA